MLRQDLQNHNNIYLQTVKPVLTRGRCHMGILPPNPPSPRKLYHIANVPPEGIPYGKPSPGRNPIAELPQGEIIPYGKPSPSMANLPTQIPYVLLGQHVRFGGGGGENPIDGELLPYGILSGGKVIHGGGSHVTPASIALQKRLPRTS